MRLFGSTARTRRKIKHSFLLLVSDKLSMIYVPSKFENWGKKYARGRIREVISIYRSPGADLFFT